ncbi:ATP-binding protein [Patulibacter minatonensis]|uniref:ATP-binding protein n=1 Tax=Patulibacter minatonensis TaxID=298163 RepID=UPI00047B9EA7|nr:ATP-binding protein [Patulibacter minatonensis]
MPEPVHGVAVRNPWVEGLWAVLGVVLATVVVGILKGEAPVVSLGVLYVVPVLLVATRAGVGLGIATAVLSMAAFNWWELPPVHRFTLNDNRHWAAMAVLLVVAVVSARIAEAGRREALRADRARREADLVADLTTLVLSPRAVADALPDVGARIAEHVGRPVVVVPWDPQHEAVVTADGGAVALDGPGGPVGLLRWTGALSAPAQDALTSRVAPSLGAVVAAGLERERLAGEAVEAAALRRSNEVATTLLRTVGHDLRTPITQIAVAAEALGSASASDEERAELAAGVLEGSDRLAGLIDKLLDLSRLEAGASAPRPDDVPLDDLVRDALQEMEATHPEAGRVRIESEDPPPRARVDPVQIGRIVVNLVENALLHGRDRETGRADVLVRVASRRGRSVVRVVDGGPGLAPSGRDELFLPFRRGGAAAGPGSGLGLAIARGFAEANGGTLRAESYPGKGTAFVLELPPAAGDDASAGPPAIAPLPPADPRDDA